LVTARAQAAFTRSTTSRIPFALRIAEMLVSSGSPSQPKRAVGQNSAGYAFDGISPQVHNPRMSWEIEASDEFLAWYDALDFGESKSVTRSIEILEHYGPELTRPQVDTLKGSSIPNLKELRVQHDGRPIRILFVFDPRRVGYLILGGDKTGDDRWYKTAIPMAEAIYQQHLREIRR
jgi:hypothetical protein